MADYANPQSSTDRIRTDLSFGLTLIESGYLDPSHSRGGGGGGGGGIPPPPPEISAVECAIAAKMGTHVTRDVIYQIVLLIFRKYFPFILY